MASSAYRRDMMRHDYSLIQVRILVSIVESLQSILHGILNNKRGFQLDLFHTDELDEDGRMPIKLPFKGIRCRPKSLSSVEKFTEDACFYSCRNTL